MEKPQTQNRNPNPDTTPERKMGKEREGQEKKKEETPAPLSPFAKTHGQNVGVGGSVAFDRYRVYAHSSAPCAPN